MALPPAAQSALDNMPHATQNHLRARYGTRAALVAALCESDTSLGGPVDDDLPDIWAEVVFAVRCEHARTVEDVLRRRLSVFRNGREQGLPASARVATLLAQELKSDVSQQAVWRAQYEAAVALSRRWASGAATAASLVTAP